jgi:hypothetical protein
MAKLDELQKEHEERLSTLLAERRGHGTESDLALVRALVHRAMHLAAETKAAEFCALATYLGEMIGHVHQLLHGSGEQSAAAHRDAVH